MLPCVKSEIHAPAFYGFSAKIRFYAAAGSGLPPELNFCKFFRLFRYHCINFLDVLVGQLLHLVLAVVQLVLGDLALLLRCLELVQCITADVAERNLGLLTGLGNALDKLLAALRRSAG